MAILTAETIEDFKNHAERRIAPVAQYRLGNTWYDVTITRKERMKDGRLAVYIPVVPHSPNTLVLTAVRLYNVSTGKVWAEKTNLNISVKGVNQSILYRFAFDVKENEVT